MKKNKKGLIIILCVLGILIINALPVLALFIFDHIEEQNKSFEIKDDVVIISEGDLIIEQQETFYDEESNSYYIIGYLKNKTDKTYEYISLEYRVYDKDGNILGAAYADIDTLNSKETWKFKAIYTDIDAKNIDSVKFLQIYYY